MLLDTNAALWVVHDSPRLGTGARARLADQPRIRFSSVSVAEISIKHMLGRVDLPGGESFPSVFTRSGLLELPFTAAHAAGLLEFESLVRHDPFDRLILAQASTEGLPLLTSDATLLSLGLRWIIDARL